MASRGGKGKTANAAWVKTVEDRLTKFHDEISDLESRLSKLEDREEDEELTTTELSNNFTKEISSLSTKLENLSKTVESGPKNNQQVGDLSKEVASLKARTNDFEKHVSEENIKYLIKKILEETSAGDIQTGGTELSVKTLKAQGMYETVEDFQNDKRLENAMNL